MMFFFIIFANKNFEIMRYVILFIAMALSVLYTSTMQAQYLFPHVQYCTGNNKYTLVRAYSPTEVVVYSEITGIGHVSLVNVISGEVRTIQLDSSVKIKDMSITSDTLYMGGGEYDSQGAPYVIGIIVYLDIRQFSSPTMTVNYYQPSYFYMNEIKEIATCTYMDSSEFSSRKTKIYTAGEAYYNCPEMCCSQWLYNNLPQVHRDYCPLTGNPTGEYFAYNTVMEITSPFISQPPEISTPHRPRHFMPVFNLSHDEEIKDVVVSGDYASFVGLEHGSTELLTVHACNIKKSFLMDTMGGDDNSYSQSRFSRYYTYPLEASGQSVIKVCPLTGGHIAVATSNEATNSGIINIRVIDLATGQMMAARNIEASDVLLDMVFDPSSGKLILLYLGNSDVNSYWLCPIDPFNLTTYNTVRAMRMANGQHLYSVDLLNRGLLVAAGAGGGITSSFPSWTASTSCYILHDFTTHKIPTIQCVIGNYDYDRCGLHSDNRSVVVTPVVSIIQGDCEVPY